MWLDHYNHQRVHSSLGSTLLEAWRDDSTTIEKVMTVELIRDCFLAERTGRKISKNGARFTNIDNGHPALAKLVCRRVTVRYLPSDCTFLDMFPNRGYVCQGVPHERLSIDDRMQIVRNRNSQTAKVERIRKYSR